jgi:hypothetical protein
MIEQYKKLECTVEQTPFEKEATPSKPQLNHLENTVKALVSNVSMTKRKALTLILMNIIAVISHLIIVGRGSYAKLARP